MGFFRRLFGSKKPKDKNKNKNKWAPISNPEFPPSHALSAAAALDPNKHAIAVAAATAAVAEAALAAAHAAAEVVRLTNSGSAAAGSSAAAVRFSRARSLAAVTIQSAFRGYLARRALRALKALVKLQALVRGNIVRKQTADMLRRMQTLVRLQARARAGRAHSSESLNSSRRSSVPNYPFPENADRIGLHQRASTSTKYDMTSILKRSGSNANVREVPKAVKTKTGSNWLDHWMEESLWKNNKNHQSPSNRYTDHEAKSDKILEVDTWRPHLDSQRSTRSFQMPRNALASDYHNHSSFAQFESPSKRSSRDETQQQSFSASSRPGSSGGGGGRRGPFTPAKSERSWGYFSAYSSHPNYMANTESSRAKVRSQSAPRQRQELSRHSATKKSSHGFWDGWEHPDSSIDVDLRSSVYPSFNPVDRLGSATLR